MEPWYHDTRLWIGLLLGALFSIPAVIMAIFLASWTPNFIRSRRQKELTKNRDQELKQYAKMKALFTGKEDKYFYFLLTATLAILSFIFGCSASIALFIRVSLGQLTLSDSISVDSLLVIFAFFGAFFTMVFLASLYLAGTNLANFKEYEKKVKEKWKLTER
jgi:hypothetical protein